MAKRSGTAGDRPFWENVKINSTEFMIYYTQLLELRISMFEWKNIPDTMDERYLELCLYSDGRAIVFEDPVIGLVNMRVAAGGTLDIYNNPTMRTAYASNNYNAVLSDKESVLVYNNRLRSASLPLIEEYARKLYELDRIIEVNAKAQKTPILISCDEKQRLTMKNLYMKYEGNEPFIFGDKNISTTPIKVISTGAPYVAEQIQILKTQIWNEALTRLGISNISLVKKERFLKDEVSRNQGSIVASRYSSLLARRKAADQINVMFPKYFEKAPLEVNFREDYQSIIGGVDTLTESDYDYKELLQNE